MILEILVWYHVTYSLPINKLSEIFFVIFTIYPGFKAEKSVMVCVHEHWYVFTNIWNVLVDPTRVWRLPPPPPPSPKRDWRPVNVGPLAHILSVPV